MKKYTFEIVITEGVNEFWENIATQGMSGCDDLIAELDTTIAEGAAGLDFSIKLKTYEDI